MLLFVQTPISVNGDPPWPETSSGCSMRQATVDDVTRRHMGSGCEIHLLKRQEFVT